jgi:hypothetical protein
MVGSTTARGDLSEMEIATALMRAGMTVLRPLSGAVRYDLVVDVGGGAFTRVQCKTGILQKGRVLFRVCSADARRPLGVSYVGQADAFGVYCPQLATTYLVPMSAVAGLGIVASLRVDASRNRQIKRVRYACDYEIKPSSNP